MVVEVVVFDPVFGVLDGVLSLVGVIRGDFVYDLYSGSSGGDEIEDCLADGFSYDVGAAEVVSVRDDVVGLVLGVSGVSDFPAVFDNVGVWVDWDRFGLILDLWALFDFLVGFVGDVYGYFCVSAVEVSW